MAFSGLETARHAAGFLDLFGPTMAQLAQMMQLTQLTQLAQLAQLGPTAPAMEPGLWPAVEEPWVAGTSRPFISASVIYQL